MTDKWVYQDYILKDQDFIERHKTHYQRYVKNIRESDQHLIRIVGELLEQKSAEADQLQLLDVGCNTGNLLLHLRAAYPEMHLSGVDISDDMIELCKSNEALGGMDFEVLNIIKSKPKNMFDCVVLNAVIFSWDSTDLSEALENIYLSLKDGGWLVFFDLFTPFKHNLTVMEQSELYPNGVALHIRSYDSSEQLFKEKSFSDVSFFPFSLSVDLTKAPDDFDVVRSHTVRTKDGLGLSFRGGLFQPWCHVVAQKY